MPNVIIDPESTGGSTGRHSTVACNEDIDMNAFDFSPLFRTAIGFDRLADALESAHRADAGGYPPYNIELTGEDRYRITMAVAGFSADEIDIETRDNLLRVSGRKSGDVADRSSCTAGSPTATSNAATSSPTMSACRAQT
jgi:hypothetical protein